jgi:hypothetical protein
MPASLRGVARKIFSHAAEIVDGRESVAVVKWNCVTAKLRDSLLTFKR